MSTEVGPRIQPVTDPTLEQAELLAKAVVATSAEPPNLFRTLAHHPLLMRRVNAVGGIFMAHTSIDARDRELLILRVAFRTGSRYELAQHRDLGLRIGVTEAEIKALTAESRDDSVLAMLPPADRVLVDLVDELIDGHDVSEQTWRDVRALHDWTDQQTLEALALVGFYAMLAGLLNAVRVPLDASVASSAN